MPWPMPREAPVTSAEGGAALRHAAPGDGRPAWPTMDRAIER